MTQAELESEMIRFRAESDLQRAEIGRLSAADSDRRKRGAPIAWIALLFGVLEIILLVAAALMHEPIFHTQGVALMTSSLAFLFIGFTNFVAAYPREVSQSAGARRQG